MEERHEKEKMRMRQRCKKETRDKRHIAVTKVKKAQQELKVGREKYKEELPVIYTFKVRKAMLLLWWLSLQFLELW